MIQRIKKPMTAFLFVSLLLHLVTYISLSISRLQTPERKPDLVEVEYQTPEEAKEQAQKREQLKRKREAPREQIVEQQKQLNDEKNDSRFLSAFNQKVIQETRADRSGAFKNTAQGGQPDEGQKDGEKKDTETPEKQVRKNKESGELPDLKDLSPKFSLSPGPKAPKQDENGDPSQTDDYIKDVKSGLQTLLSTREFVYYSYYNRIKESLRQHWEPNVKEKVKIIYRQGRTIASAKDRVTQLLVTLDAQGELIDVEVISHSGVDDLDKAAVEAFRAAAPFPNPPKGMVEKDGKIKIRWDFVLES